MLLFNNFDKEQSIFPEIIEVVTDADGNLYQAVKISIPTWMLENFKTTSFNDKTPITKYTFEIHGSSWLNLNTRNSMNQWTDTADLNNLYDPELPFNFYGIMYNHLAIESGKLAPVGWRIPSVQDFRELKNYLYANSFVGEEAITLKTATDWFESSGKRTNAVVFNGLPNG